MAIKTNSRVLESVSLERYAITTYGRYNRRRKLPDINYKADLHIRNSKRAIREAAAAFQKGHYDAAIRFYPAKHPELRRMGMYFLQQRHYLQAILAFEKAQDNIGLIMTGNALLEWDNYWLALEAFSKCNYDKGIVSLMMSALDNGELPIVKDAYDKIKDKHNLGSLVRRMQDAGIRIDG